MKTRNASGRDDARGFARVAFSGRVIYRYGADDEGAAVAHDVSRSGLKLRMGRYLRPGTHVMLEAPNHHVDGRCIELKAQIVWCAAEKRGHRFVAGVRVIYDEPDAVIAASALVNHAIVEAGLLDGLRACASLGAHVSSIENRALVMGQRRIGSRFLAGNA